MTLMFSIFTLVIKFDCLVLVIFQSFHLIVIFPHPLNIQDVYQTTRMFQLLLCFYSYSTTRMFQLLLTKLLVCFKYY